MIFKPLKKIFLSPRLPGDKSLSHRALILGALAKGLSQFQNLSTAQDVESTKMVLSQLGVEFSFKNECLFVSGLEKKLKASKVLLDCGNAGTLMRLMMGVLAGQNFSSTLIGDDSLQKRPMRRVSDPLTQMRAKIFLKDNQYAPVQIEPSLLQGRSLQLKVASAQVKSAILLAGLFCKEETIIEGKIKTRDHTERLLRFFGVDLVTSEEKIILRPNQNLTAQNYFIPNDISAASFWMASALLSQEGNVLLKNVGLNHYRLGFVDVLKKIGAQISLQVEKTYPEPVGQIRVKSGKLKPFVVSSQQISSLIDEIPLLALIATQIPGTSKILGAEELRYKESDRLSAIKNILNNLGARVVIEGNDLIIEGGSPLKGGFVETYGDHRIAMMGSVARFCSLEEIELSESKSAGVSDPYFISTMESL